MKYRTLLFPTVAAALLLAAPPTPAQEMRATEPVISIDFDGGSLSDLIEMIRGAGQNINILIPPEADEVQVPSMSLKEVTVESTLRAIANVASNEMVNVDMSVQRQPPGQPVFSMRVDLDRASGPRPSSRYVEVYSIRGLTEAMPREPEIAQITLSSETILTAIDTGMEVSATDADKPVIRYHEESGLLFVRASSVQHGLIRDVIQNMIGDLDRRRDAARRAGAQSGPGRGGRSGR